MGLPGKFFLLLVTLFLCGASIAQDLPEVSSPHGFWDRANKMLFATHATLEAVDFGITHHNLSDGGRELDPMAKALCESGTAGQFRGKNHAHDAEHRDSGHPATEQKRSSIIQRIVRKQHTSAGKVRSAKEQNLN